MRKNLLLKNTIIENVKYKQLGGRAAMKYTPKKETLLDNMISCEIMNVISGWQR